MLGSACIIIFLNFPWYEAATLEFGNVGSVNGWELMPYQDILGAVGAGLIVVGAMVYANNGGNLKRRGTNFAYVLLGLGGLVLIAAGLLYWADKPELATAIGLSNASPYSALKFERTAMPFLTGAAGLLALYGVGQLLESGRE